MENITDMVVVGDLVNTLEVLIGIKYLLLLVQGHINVFFTIS